jgi:hypothetical protein
MLAWIIALFAALSPFGPTEAASRCYPTFRFAVLSGGMVQDTLTQLRWQQDGSGTRAGCSGTGNLTCTWVEAKAYCASLALGGLSGWRLPTVRELRSLVDYTVAHPGSTINKTAFPNTPTESFWTSSQYAGSSGNAWYVSFADGSSDHFGNVVGYNDEGDNNRVRCVR